MGHWFWAVEQSPLTLHTINTAITGLTTSTNPLCHTLFPSLQSLASSAAPSATVDSTITLSDWNRRLWNHCDACWKHSHRLWTCCITPHSRSHPPSIRPKQTPAQRFQGQDFCWGDCAGCFSVEGGSKCIYVPLRILYFLCSLSIFIQVNVVIYNNLWYLLQYINILYVVY